MGTIQHLRSTVAGHVPSSLVQGQIGINEADQKLFYRSAAGAVLGVGLDMDLLAKGSVSNAANLNLMLYPWFSRAYTAIKIILTRLRSSTADDTELWVRYSGNNGSSYYSGSTDYTYATANKDYGTIFAWSDSDSNFMVVNYVYSSTAYTSHCEVTIPRPDVSGRHAVRHGFINSDGMGFGMGRSNGFNHTLTAIRFQLDSGNLNCNYSMLGVR